MRRARDPEFGAGVLLACVLLALAGSASAEGEPPADPVAEEKSLEERIEELERAKAAYEEATRERERLEQRVEELEKAMDAPANPDPEEEQLERRVEELELAQGANEDATRSIIRQTFETWGSMINEYVSLGGVLEILTGAQEDYFGRDEKTIRLNTAELQFEIQVVDWARGSLVLEYDDGSDLVFPTIEDDEFSVDKINVDTAEIIVGNTERFWPYGRFGRIVVPFGISTGDPVADVLTITEPLTVEAFETLDDALLIGVEFPTPPLTPPVLTPAPPPVRPLVVNPLVSRLSRLLGYKPLPAPPPIPALVAPPPVPPPFSAAFYLYNGDTFQSANRSGEWDPGRHYGATLGYRTRGSCRSSLDDPEAAGVLGWLRVLCPWAIDADVDFNRSVFDSNFLAFEYRSFLQQIGVVSGMAAHAKATLGPVGLVAEWNGAIDSTSFIDDRNLVVHMRPSAWQVSLAYQFDWNPSVESIGAQGTYVAFSYSESRDLAGVTRFNNQNNEENRIGFIPRRRIAVDVGEWVLENLRLAFEYAYALDYARNQAGVAFSSPNALIGGTDRSAHAFFAMLTFEW